MKRGKSKRDKDVTPKTFRSSAVDEKAINDT